MAPEQYFFWVNSEPKISEELWREFYTSEHIPDIVNSGCATRACFYEEIPTPLDNADTKTKHARNYLALYQTPHRELLKAPGHVDVRTTSELFAREGGTNVIMVEGDFNGRNYELVQGFDPLSVGESTPPPQVLTVEMHPKNTEDFDKWYREEHLLMLQKLPGYRRTLRYKIGPDSGVAKDFQPDYLAVHEMEDISAFGGKEAEAANTTPWTVKNVEDSKVFIARGWKLIYSLGY